MTGLLRPFAMALLSLGAAAAQTPEQRALEYLAQEVPRWHQENRCFSCHNNGDGARALYAAALLKYNVPPGALAATTDWLLDPGRWDSSATDASFKDKKLGRIQFAASLAQAYEAGFVRDRAALARAAEALLPHQEADGSWTMDASAAAGSPATYGTALATYMARGALDRAGEARFAGAISKANRWFLAARPRSIPDAAAMLLAMPRDASVKRKCLELILRGQTSDGGWGPQPNAPAEAFDTAIVLLALQGLNQPGQAAGPIARGRAFLVAAQQQAGGWPETTRPPGGRSYAQHISTSAWATLALLATDAKGQ